MTKNALTRLLAPTHYTSTPRHEPELCLHRILVGKDASADGSVMISYSADSHTLYGELLLAKAADLAPGSMRQITEWDSGEATRTDP